MNVERSANPDGILTPTTLVDELAYRLQKEILDGTLRPGHLLIQEDICARFGVSRTPVREALRLLNAQRLVELYANRSARVRHPERKEMSDTYMVRAELEGLACELAAEHTSPHVVAELEAAQAELELAAEQAALVLTKDEPDQANVHEALRECNERFHGAIHRATNSPTLTTLIRGLMDSVPKDFVWRALVRSEDATMLTVVQHRQIIESLARGDGSAARSNMREHVLLSGRLLIEYLNQHDFWPDTQSAVLESRGSSSATKG
jgi:DNA-binding GntR family transcriptional regulator